MHRRQVIVGFAAVFLARGGRAGAAEVRDFDAKAFAAAQEQSQGIVVEVHAPW